MSEAATSPATEFDALRLIERHQAGVWRYLRALGCEPSSADDLTQDTFLAVIEKPFDDYHPAATAAYLRRVAYNLFVTTRRRSGRISTVENIEELDKQWQSWAGETDGQDAVDALRDCLAHLTERARWALDMRFRERLTRVQIATALEITEHGAKNLMQRAKGQLKTCVEKKLNQP